MGVSLLEGIKMKRLLELNGTELVMLKACIRRELNQIKENNSINAKGYTLVFTDILARLDDPDMNNAECEALLGR